MPLFAILNSNTKQMLFHYVLFATQFILEALGLLDFDFQ